MCHAGVMLGYKFKTGTLMCFLCNDQWIYDKVHYFRHNPLMLYEIWRRRRYLSPLLGALPGTVWYGRFVISSQVGVWWHVKWSNVFASVPSRNHFLLETLLLLPWSLFCDQFIRFKSFSGVMSDLFNSVSRIKSFPNIKLTCFSVDSLKKDTLSSFNL